MFACAFVYLCTHEEEGERIALWCQLFLLSFVRHQTQVWRLVAQVPLFYAIAAKDIPFLHCAAISFQLRENSLFS